MEQRTPGLVARRGCTALATCVVTAALMAGCSGKSGPSAAPSRTSSTPASLQTPQQVLSNALAAAGAKQWVHMDVQTSARGHVIAFSDDDGPDTGIQRITIRGGGSGLVRVIGSTTYMKADQTALAGYFGLSPQAAGRAANRWLRLEKNDSGYAAVTEGVSITSAIHELVISPPLRLLPQQQRGGSTVIGVAGAAGGNAPAGATATLWIDPQTGLPVEYDASAPGGDGIVSRMSQWGRPVAVTKPATSTSIKQFGG